MNAWWRSAWWAVAASVVPVGLMLYGVSVPGGYYDQLAASLWCWTFVGVAWLATGVAKLSDSPEPPWRMWPLLVVPLMFAASWLVSSGDLVGKATFRHYRAGLERLADTAPPHQPAGVGPYAFNAVGWTGDCVLYDLRDPGIVQASGFAWCPGSSPAALHWGEGEAFERIAGDWYVYVVRHGLFKDRAKGAGPWGFQITELRPVSDV